MSTRVLVALALLCSCSLARAETHFLESHARALPLSWSASRDAPITELAYGPRAYGSFGVAPAIVTFSSGSELRVGVSAAFAWEASDSSGFSALLHRDLEALTLAVALHDVFAARDTFELTTSIGHEGSHASLAAPTEPYRPTDIPFGAGGSHLGMDLALRLWPSNRLSLVSRLGERVYVNAFPLWVGAREESDHVADALSEGVIHAPFAALELRQRTTRGFQPLVSVFGEAQLAHDDSARDAVLVRALVGAALPGAGFELVPFVAGDAGNGKGLLVNRRELRLSAGLRLTPKEARP
ncbi:MAG: hypothetical protein U0263_22430 [Polyangiaceae bacterium]